MAGVDEGTAAGRIREVSPFRMRAERSMKKKEYNTNDYQGLMAWEAY